MRFLTRTARFLQPACLATALMSATLATAQADEPINEQLVQRASNLIDRLDAETLDERDQVSEALRSFSGPLERIVAQRINLDDLSPEQLARLDEALYERFAEQPRAGMGVAFAVTHPGGGVLLQRILPNFPASEHLKPGDVIQSVQGDSLTSMPDASARAALRWHILSFIAGESIEVKVLRQGQPLTLRVPLGSYEQLGNASPVSDVDMRSAWRLRRDRLGLNLRPDPPITPPISLSDWPAASSQNRSGSRSNASLAAAGDSAPMILPRDGEGTRPKLGLAANQRRPLQLRVVVNDNRDARRVRGDDDDDDRRRRAQIKQLIERWERERNEAFEIIRDPDADRLSRQDALKRAAQATAAIDVLQERLRDLDE